mmetsp:Transcript_48865/g.118303  ORF Transcript_48865/g.118303 Transcript_48865/m.118303 type:complete len:1220 (-) Transcript_48865:96-3755(-)|eukprot:CAMPEP_0113454050 /NCGR_PEP_ID=MMETSP0014_2-20120614/7667_1 /TAXON_ID=2857 /ORGANISM="Nitzschia sp." /LENGTH=1219 /DNA_ID=CAMNT_0000345451 /DNA_START=265 /DNA_END=3924 /DNA_ORIENTATION=- /assembly_acc=CAM_ASM_000159
MSKLHHRRYRSKLLILLSILQIVVVTYVVLVLFTLQQNHHDTKTTIIDNIYDRHHQQNQNHPVGSKRKDSEDENISKNALEISKIEVVDIKERKHKRNKTNKNNVSVEDDSSSKWFLSKFNPPGTIKPDAIIQIEHSDEDGNTKPRLVVVGGFTTDYGNVSKWIHFFDIQSQTWTIGDSIKMPDHIAETHQGVTYDKSDHVLYIVAGQKGRGCQSATTSCTRLWIHSGRFEDLPPLPEPRYSPAVELVIDRTSLTRPKKYLHAFGGAGPNRKDGMTNHWRLDLHNLSSPSPSLSPSSLWETLESVPDAGIHGVSFVSSTQGYMYYTAYCTMDQMVHRSSSRMKVCHQHATDQGQLLHHVSDVGLTYRYPVWKEMNASGSRDNMDWERVQDMPFPSCHGGSVAVNDRLVIVGGGLATSQSKVGSAPRSLPLIQIFDARTEKWQVFPFRIPQKRMHLFLLTTWFDEQRRMIYSLHPGNVVVAVTLKESPGVFSSIISDKNNINPVTVVKPILVDDFTLRQTRRVNIETFQSCLTVRKNDGSYDHHKRNNTSSVIPIYTVLDKNNSGYESARRTWNGRNEARQYPDIVVFPSDENDVSNIVMCSRRTGYRMCARNGKHSYDGSSVCGRSVVVDVTRLKMWTVYTAVNEGINSTGLNPSVVMMKFKARFGAGFTLGQVTDVLYSHGLTLPMGSCASVGVTGLTLSGGFGPLSRMYGLSCDHLDSIELVDANGSIVNATETNDLSDLLWLARGGGTAGPHFPGIITALTFNNLIRIPSPSMHKSNTNRRGKYIKDVLPYGDMSNTTWTKVKIRYPPTVKTATDLIVSWHNFMISVEANEKKEKNNRRLQIWRPAADHSNYLELDPEWLDHARRLTVEPWIVLSPKRRRRQRRQKSKTNITQLVSTDIGEEAVYNNSNDEWERSLFLNVYFFGDEVLHSDIFVPHILPVLKNWTTNDETHQRDGTGHGGGRGGGGGGGRVTKMERLDHLSFQCKIGGLRNHSELISGRHGHDTGGQSRWKGYSYVYSSMTTTRSHEKTLQSSIRTAVERLSRGLWSEEPLTKRYAEFKPFGGAIRSYDDDNDESTSRVGGAFPHRNSLWCMLVNNFYSSVEEESRILASAHRTYSRFVQPLEEAMATKTTTNGTLHDHATMYSGYVDHEDFASNNSYNNYNNNVVVLGYRNLMERYYGKDNSRRIMDIVHKFDPHTIFRRTQPFSGRIRRSSSTL